MTGADIIAQIASQNFPAGSFIVFGAGPLAAAGIRETGDIDLVVTPELYAELIKRGWKKCVKAPGDEPLRHGVFEAHDNWSFEGYTSTFEALLATADFYEGIPFASLQEVRAWKTKSTGKKHKADIDLINAYLAGKKS